MKANELKAVLESKFRHSYHVEISNIDDCVVVLIRDITSRCPDDLEVELDINDDIESACVNELTDFYYDHDMKDVIIAESNQNSNEYIRSLLKIVKERIYHSIDELDFQINSDSIKIFGVHYGREFSTEVKLSELKNEINADTKYIVYKACDAANSICMFYMYFLNIPDEAIKIIEDSIDEHWAETHLERVKND